MLLKTKRNAINTCKLCLGFKSVNFLRYVKKDARISLAGTDLVVANITQEVDIIIILCMLMIITMV